MIVNIRAIFMCRFQKRRAQCDVKRRQKPLPRNDAMMQEYMETWEEGGGKRKIDVEQSNFYETIGNFGRPNDWWS